MDKEKRMGVIQFLLEGATEILGEKTLKELNQNKDREIMNISLNSLNSQQFLKELKKD